MNVRVRVTDSHNAYPTVWVNAPANDRTMANYNLKTPKENIISWRECGGAGEFNESRHAGRESKCEYIEPRCSDCNHSTRCSVREIFFPSGGPHLFFTLGIIIKTYVVLNILPK